MKSSPVPLVAGQGLGLGGRNVSRLSKETKWTQSFHPTGTCIGM